MLSTDENIETIAQLVAELKRYLGLQGEYVRLDATEKTVRLLTAAVVFVVVAVLVGLVAIFLALALAAVLAPVLGMPLALLAVAGCCLVVLLVVVAMRHSWIERPLVRLMAGILLDDSDTPGKEQSL